jgi:hypothetical protein
MLEACFMVMWEPALREFARPDRTSSWPWPGQNHYDSWWTLFRQGETAEGRNRHRVTPELEDEEMYIPMQLRWCGVTMRIRAVTGTDLDDSIDQACQAFAVAR